METLGESSGSPSWLKINKKAKRPFGAVAKIRNELR
jgi:hypothetical protein